MNPELRDRVVLPIAIPIGALLLLELFVLPFSRILLAVGKQPAVVVAGVAAGGILFGCAAIAGAPRLRPTTLYAIGVLGLAAVVGGGVLALPHVEAGLATHAHEAPHDVVEETVTLSASNNAFDTDELEVPAGEDFVLRFTHTDPEPHNVAIFFNETMEEVIFRGDIISAGEVAEYEIPALQAGEYFFHCDVHPFMQGAVQAH